MLNAFGDAITEMRACALVLNVYLRYCNEGNGCPFGETQPRLLTQEVCGERIMPSMLVSDSLFTRPHFALPRETTTISNKQ
jgi:hypothetical protein